MHILQAQVGEEHRYRAIKHFPDSFPVYRLPVHTNVDKDPPLRISISILLCLAFDKYSTQCIEVSLVLDKFSGTTIAHKLYYVATQTSIPPEQLCSYY